VDSSFGGRRHDAGLLFVSYQRDPRIGYIKILHRMSKLDMLIQCTTHIGSGVFACPGGVAEDEFNLSAMPSRNGRYLRAPRKGGAFHWVRAPPGARSIRKQNRMRLIAGQEPVHAQERRFDRPVAAHDHGSGFVRNGDPARRTDAQTEHGAASNLLKSFRDQAALHGQLEVETLDVIKPDDHGSEAASRRTALRRHVCRRRP
jgi:hypothetical protein